MSCLRPFAICLLASPLVWIAADAAAAAAAPVQGWPNLCADGLVGTSGFEPEVAAEWNAGLDQSIRLRPELLISTDGRPGIGMSVTWRMDFHGALPRDQEFFLGPRVLYHNADRWGWEGDLAAFYSFPIGGGAPQHHYLQVIGALGLEQERAHDGTGASLEFGASIGLGYAYHF